MSGKNDKKLRRLARQSFYLQATQSAKALQGLIIGCRLRKRLSIAWQIVRGKPFLG